MKSSYMRSFLALGMIVASFMSLHAQENGSIKGRLTDNETGDAVTFAQLLLKPIQMETITDEGGNYQFESHSPTCTIGKEKMTDTTVTPCGGMMISVC